MRVSALIVNYNSGDFAIKCVESLIRDLQLPASHGLELECIIVDNDSPQDQSRFRRLCEAKGAQWIDHGWNAGYSAGVNRAFKESTGDLILISNPDVEFQEGSLSRLVKSVVDRPEIGAAGPKTWWDNHREIQFPPNILPSIGDAFSVTLAHLCRSWNRRHALRRTSVALPAWVEKGEVPMRLLSGGCLITRRDLWLQVGEFDERFPLYYEDTDWFVRVRKAGFKLIQVQDAHITHHFNRSGITAGETAMSRYWTSRRRYYRKHYGRFGQWVAEVTQGVVNSKWAQYFIKKPMDRIHDLGTHQEPLVLQLPRTCSTYLLELAQDPGFFMAGAIFGSGDCWQASPECWDVFASSHYYLRGVDLSGAKPKHLGTWLFQKG